jgi:hypothetical protein
MKYWHFLPNDGCLRYGDRIKVVAKHTYTLPIDTKIIPCSVGFHASTRAIDALKYAPGSLVSLCTLHGDIVPHGDPIEKYAAHGRTHLWIANADAVLREFSRWCALSVIHLWDAPQIVYDYLNTGDEKYRDTAWAAARDAAGDAAWAAAWAAARAAAGAAARAAAGAAARAAARDDQNKKLEAMLMTLTPKEE